MNNTLLNLKDLKIEFSYKDSFYPVVDSISLSIKEEECLCIIGESGSGKSMTALALMQLLPEQARFSAKEILFQDTDLLSLSRKEISNILGNRMAMIFQDPMSSLNPVLTIGEQIAEPLIRHKNYSKKQALDQTIALMQEVGIEQPELRIKSYPHEFSGGMLQRVMIAMMISCNPALLIADEPTTALDIQTQKNIIQLLNKLRKDHKMGLVFISHDMHIAKEIADNIAVMYAGKIVEYAKKEDFFSNPMHPYSKALLASIPNKENQKLKRLPTIEGNVPKAYEQISGCRFKNRCKFQSDICNTPPIEQNTNNRKILCHHIN